MNRTTGILKLVTFYWLIIMGVLGLISITHGISMVPYLLGIYIVFPDGLQYAFFAGLGWIGLYSLTTIDVFRRYDISNLIKFFDSIDNRFKAKIICFAWLYIGFLLAVSSVVGVGIHMIIGSPAIAIAVVVVFPWLDLYYAARKKSLGFLFLKGLLGCVHLFGILRDTSAESIMESLAQPTL